MFQVEKRRTKYKDIIPPYDAKTDDFAKRYFKNPEVQKTIDITIDTPRLTQMVSYLTMISHFTMDTHRLFFA